MADTIKLRFELERSTKNTHRFQEVGDPQVIGTLYVQKAAFPDGEPSVLVVTLSAEPATE